MTCILDERPYDPRPYDSRYARPDERRDDRCVSCYREFFFAPSLSSDRRGHAGRDRYERYDRYDDRRYDDRRLDDRRERVGR